MSGTDGGRNGSGDCAVAASETASETASKTTSKIFRVFMLLF